MPYTMKTVYLLGLLWLYLLGFVYVVCVEPGFLDFDNLPDTNFSCVGKVIGGYYADLETNCQMFHVCTIGQLDEPMDIRFLCLNGTVFDQETRVCERIDEVDCSKSEKFYSLNLELYGNTQPSISEDNSETDPPIIIKASTTTTTTTTTPKPKTTKPPFFTTLAPTVTTVTKVISAHHFPISSGPDIRFNPEEINISLNSGTVPNIRSKSVAYQQQVFNDNKKKVVVTTHTSYGAPEKDFVRVVPNTQRPVSSTQKVKGQSAATPADINYGFTYHQTDNLQEYTEAPHNYQYHHSNVPYRGGQFRNQFKTTTYRTEHVATTRKHPYNPSKEPTTFRTPYVASLKTPTYHTYRTEKPQRLQLPLPLLPTLPPLTFSSPAPFSLGHHIETKRYTSDQPPPRIIISASASVSDNSGRRLNYSLGTIGVTPLLEVPPKSYDEYKDHDVVLDPFYHDVPKIKASRRRKRQVKPADANSEQAAVDVLKFLFEWYSTQRKSSTVKVPIDPEDITEINDQLAPIVEAPFVDQNKSEDVNFRESALFKKKSKFNIVGDVLSVTEAPTASTSTPVSVTVAKLDTVDYVDDNYEAVAPLPNNNVTEETKVKVTTTEQIVTTVTETTLPPTTTTTEPTTTSRIMGLMRKRAKTHHKRIMNENRRRYIASLNALKPKIRRRDKQKTTTVAHIIAEIVTVASPTQIPVMSSTTDTTSTKSTTVATTTERIATEKTEVLNEEEKEMRSTIPEENKTEPINDVGPQQEESQVVHVSAEPTTLATGLYEDKEAEDDQIKQESNVNHNYEETTTEFEQSTSQNEDDSPAEDSQMEEHTEELESTVADTTTEVMEVQNGLRNEETTTIQKEESEVVNVKNDVVSSKPRTRGRGRSRFYNNDRSDHKARTTTSESVKFITETTEDSINEDETRIENLETTTFQENNEDIDMGNEEAAVSKPEHIEYDHEDKPTTESPEVKEDEKMETISDEPEIASNDKVSSETDEDENNPDNEALNSTTADYTDKDSEILEENKETVLIKPKSAEVDDEPSPSSTTDLTDNEETSSEFEREGTVLSKSDDAESNKDFENQEEESHFDEIDKEEEEVRKPHGRGRGRGRNRFHNHNKADKETTKDETNEKEAEPKIEDRTEEAENRKEIQSAEEFSIKSENDNTLEPVPTTTESAPLSEKDDHLNVDNETEDVDEILLSTTIAGTTLEDIPSTSLTTSTTEYYKESTTLNVNNDVYQTVATESSSTISTEGTTHLTPSYTTTTELPSTARIRLSARRTRPSRTRTSSSYRRPNSRHRFSNESRPSRRKPAIEEEIIDALTNQLTTTESLTRKEISTSPQITTSTVDYIEDVPATDAPLFKSANPTQAESAKESLHTTPLSMVYKLQVRKEKLKSYIFNCFGKAINKFYSDPRDCRLFHYCTSGYTKNQLLDMKFVCDLGTYFDEEKLICTKVKPERCL